MSTSTSDRERTRDEDRSSNPRPTAAPAVAGFAPPSHLDVLESDSIAILREVAAQFEKPVLLYSIGKDSTVLLELARRAFAPGRIPFPLLHIDTGYEFPEVLEYRDRLLDTFDVEWDSLRNEEGIAAGAHPAQLGVAACCSALRTAPLLETLSARGHDAAIGGARRDEERSRAKERIFSVRDPHGQWDPRRQRPEPWAILNGRRAPGETVRVFPLSNWTEFDIWSYVHREKIELAPLYFAHERDVVRRGPALIPVGPATVLREDETIERVSCRFRSLGCAPCTGAVPSHATSVAEILAEMRTTRISERAGRITDHGSGAGLEALKQQGFF